MVDLGVFEIAVLAGLFLLFVVVAAIGFLIYRRYTNKSAFSVAQAASPAVDPRARPAARQEAEDAALQLRADADAYAGEVRSKSDAQCQGPRRSTARRRGGDPAASQ